MRSIVASPLTSITEVTLDNVINISCGPESDLLFLSLSQAPDYRTVQPGWASFAKNRADHVNTFTIHRQSNSHVSRIELQPTRENYRFIQPLPIDNWLVVRSRAQNELDTNAHIYDSSGEKVRSFHAGDAIQDVQTTEDGQIWISYFDEAAAGGVGIGGKGLASFDEKGDLVFGFDELFDKHDLPQIDDCYAMNVSSPNETWICYYMDFPLVKIVDRQLDRVWKDFPIGGASAFAVSKNRVLLAGLYKYPQSLFLVDLTSQDVEELNAVTHAGTPITFSSAFGRGPRLYLRTQTEIFEIDLRKT